MAAEKPIVSTGITMCQCPTVRSSILAEDARAFVKACEGALDHSADRSAERALMQRVVAQSSWDTTAERMHELIEDIAGEDWSMSAATQSLPPCCREPETRGHHRRRPTGSVQPFISGRIVAVGSKNDTWGLVPFR